MRYSLGDGLRPGSIADASDAAQFAELHLGSSPRSPEAHGAQVMIEGRAISQCTRSSNVRLEDCVRGPVLHAGSAITDIAPAYDHITSAIGAAIALSRYRDAGVVGHLRFTY